MTPTDDRSKQLQMQIDMYVGVIETYSSRLSKLREELQSICTHPSIYKVYISTDHDYTVYYEHICSTCDKTEIVQEKDGDLPF
jgi:hypothetical protein